MEEKEEGNRAYTYVSIADVLDRRRRRWIEIQIFIAFSKVDFSRFYFHFEGQTTFIYRARLTHNGILANYLGFVLFEFNIPSLYTVATFPFI